MTKKEYQQVIETIEKYMTVLHESPYNPRLVLTSFGLSQVKQDLKGLVKDNDLH